MDGLDYTSQLLYFRYFGMVGSCTLSRGKRPGKHQGMTVSSGRTLSVNGQFLGGVVSTYGLFLTSQFLTEYTLKILVAALLTMGLIMISIMFRTEQLVKVPRARGCPLAGWVISFRSQLLSCYFSCRAFKANSFYKR